MRVTRLNLSQFRNLGATDLETDARFVVLLARVGTSDAAFVDDLVAEVGDAACVVAVATSRLAEPSTLGTT